MKLLRLAFPLTIFSYLPFEKWWYCRLVDAPDKLLYGFPFINCCQSLASSMEWNYFVWESFLNIAVFAAFWLAVVFLIDRFVKPIRISKWPARVAGLVLGLYILGFTWISVTFNTTFYPQRNVQIQVLDSGYEWAWDGPPQIEHKNY